MSKHKKSKSDGDRDVADSPSKAPGLPVAVSPSSGVRLLRERLESAPKRPREKLLRALALLEEEYDRTIGHGRADADAPGQKGEDPPGTGFPAKLGRPDVSFVPTPPELVEAMLELAEVRPEDTVYDLGSGDGRLVIGAAAKYGARGVGLEIDPERITEAQDAAHRAGVSDRVTFRRADLFAENFREATVVMLYLLPALNLELRKRLLEQLAPGTRIVSHAFDMGNWAPTRQINVAGRQIYLWTVPERSPET